jgi:hypothetical protein
VRRADNLTTFMCRLSRNSGASTSRTPVGLSRPVMEYIHVVTLLDLIEPYIEFTVELYISFRNDLSNHTADEIHTS